MGNWMLLHSSQGQRDSETGNMALGSYNHWQFPSITCVLIKETGGREHEGSL